MTRAWVRWLPAGVVPVVVVAAAVAAPLQAVAEDLPDKTPQQLLGMMASSSTQSFSGEIEQTSELGLPELPSTGDPTLRDASSALELLSGSHTARVYAAGPQKLRVQVMDSLAERDLVRNGSDVWFYASRGNTVTHVTLPSGTSDVAAPDSGAMHTPADLADALVDELETDSQLTVGDDGSVAGRPAYDLVLTPKQGDTLVGRVSIAIDSTTGLPLELTVHARGQDAPAFSVGFTEVSFETPDDALFDFEPPAGSTVTEKALPENLPTRQEIAAAAADAREQTAAAVTGSGWSRVVEVTPPAESLAMVESPLFEGLTTEVDGGRAITTSLVTVLLTDDGRVLAGSVPVSRLQDVAAGK